MPKFYVGRGKTEVNRFGNNECKINICLDDIPEAAIFNAKNGKRYLNLTISKLKNADDRGNTHSVQGWHKDEDYQQAPPVQQSAPPQQTQQAPQNPQFDATANDDCPF